MFKASVLGSGSWGTALSLLLAKNGVYVCLWGRNNDDIETICRDKENSKYLPGFTLPEEVEAVSEPPSEAELWVVAVPSEAVREVCELLPAGRTLVVMAAKGLEPGTSKRMSEVLQEVRPDAQACLLSGPNLAVELANETPSATVIASNDPNAAERVRSRLMCRYLRIYLSADVVGVELGGALKNVLAIGAGMSDSLGFGDNTKGALLARGLGEIADLGCALGAERSTFMGLSGVGDLFATAASTLSRNYRVGRAIAQGKGLQEALTEIGQVAEGVPTCRAVTSLARSVQVEIPLMAAIGDVVEGKISPLDAVGELMTRTPRCEV